MGVRQSVRSKRAEGDAGVLRNRRPGAEVAAGLRDARISVATAEKYRRVVESSGESIAVIGADGVYRYINPAGARVLGGRPRDFVGRTMWDVFPKAIADRQVAAIRETIRSRRGGVRDSFTSIGGEPRFYRTRIEPIRDEDGVMRSALVIPRDEQHLHEARESLLAAQRLAGMGSWDYDVRRRRIKWSEPMCRILGLDPEGFRPTPANVRRFFPRETRDAISDAVADARKGDGRFHVETKIRTRRGELRNVVLDGVASADSTGRLSRVLGVMLDVTQRKHMEESRATVLRAMRHGLFILQEGRVVFANPAMARICGVSIDGLLALSAAELTARFRVEDPERLLRRYRSREKGASPVDHYEIRAQRPDGETRWLEVWASRITYRNKPAVLDAVIDITARKEAELALRASEEKYRALVEQAADAILVTDSDGVVRELNRGAAEMLGRPRGRILGRRVTEIVQPENAVEGAFDWKSIQRGESAAVTLQRRKPDGDTAHVEFSIRRLRDGRVQMIGRDVSERRRLENEILAISRRERREIAQTLHDSLGQQLSGVSYMARALQKRLAGRSDPESASRAGLIATTMEKALALTREIVRGISPVDIAENGLAHALRRLAGVTESVYGKRCRTVVREPAPVYDYGAATHLYYIAAEAVGNAIRHGRPSRVTIRLSANRTHGRLTVSDNGRGLAVPGRRGKGLGLGIMRHRAEVIGGRLMIVRNPKGGTRIECRFPNVSPPAGAMAGV